MGRTTFCDSSTFRNSDIFSHLYGKNNPFADSGIPTFENWFSFGRPTAMGLKKKKNEQISVGHFCGKHAMGAKKTGMLQKKIVGLCFFCGHLYIPPVL